MRSGDYSPSRLEAMNDAVNQIVDIKINGNAETTVGVLSMAGSRQSRLFLIQRLLMLCCCAQSGGSRQPVPQSRSNHDSDSERGSRILKSQVLSTPANIAGQNWRREQLPWRSESGAAGAEESPQQESATAHHYVCWQSSEPQISCRQVNCAARSRQVNDDIKELTKLGKQFKKNNVAVRLFVAPHFVGA